MKKITFLSRVILGAIFLIFGINSFRGFIDPPVPPKAAMPFLEGLFSTGYFFPLLKFIEMVCGLLLLSGYFVPLALVCLAPIIINIFFFHLFLDLTGLPLAIIMVTMEVFLIFFSYREHLQGIWTCPRLKKGV